MLKTKIVPSDFIVQVRDHSSTLSAEIEQTINEIWETEKIKRGGKLFNGQILSFIGFEKGILEARITDYRTYLAQMRAPHLYDALRIRTLAVSGFVALGSEVVFGKRAVHLTQDAGKWELVPSGGLTPRALDSSGRISIEEQFFEELEEELRLPRKMVVSMRPFLFVEDMKTRVIDIGIDVALSGTRSDIDVALKRRSDEYSEIRWIDAGEINQFCSVERSGIVEVSLELLKAKKLLL